MPDDLTAVIAIIMIAGITLASRIAGAFVMSRVEASPKVAAFLDALSISVIAALVASIIAQNDLREAAAVALAALVMLGSQSAVWAMVIGMACAAGWPLLGGLQVFGP